MKYYLSLILLAIVFAFPAAVRAQKSAVLTGTLTDTVKHKTLGMATVGIYRQSDSALIAFKFSNDQGVFKIQGLPADTALSLIITYVGYKVYQKDTVLAAGLTDLGTVVMFADATPIDAVLVKAHRPPVSVKNDTLEFNAGSFKTLPAALTEDLLKKLPGVHVDKEGNITVNGVKVNRIVVDGKEFFGDNTAMALKNLPANVIDKIQVTSDREAQDKNPDAGTQEAGKVINLKLKKGVKKGWFGKVYAGTDAQDKYQAGGIMNLYRDTFQLSLIGYGNNVNTQGFGYSDLRSMAGFSRSGINSWSNSGRTGTTINGFNVGGGYQGITRSGGGGFNLNAIPDKKLSVNTQYYWSGSNNRSEMLSNTKQLINDSQFNTTKIQNGNSISSMHTLQATIQYKPDTLTSIYISPQFSAGKSNDTTYSSTKSYGESRDINRSTTSENQEGTNYTGNIHTWLTSSSRKNKDRRLVLYSSVNMSDNKSDLYNTWDARYFSLTDTTNTLVRQLRTNNTAGKGINSGASYYIPLNKLFKVKLGMRHNYQYSSRSIATFFPVGGGNEFSDKQENLSSLSKRTQQQYTPGMSFIYSKNTAFSIFANLDVTSLTIDVINTGYAPLKQSYLRLLPSLNIRNKSYYGSYDMSLQAPSAEDIQPLLNNTNPLYLTIGNPNLKAGLQHRIYFNQWKYNTGKTINYYNYFNATLKQNDVIYRRTIDSIGVQRTYPENVNGNKSLSYSAGFDKEIKKVKENISFVYSFGFDFVCQDQALYLNDVMARQNSQTFSPSVYFTLNFNDIFELEPSYDYSYSYTAYNKDAFAPRTIQSHQAGGEITMSWPGRVVWNSSAKYIKNTGISTNIASSYTLWNASVSYGIDKDRLFELRLAVNDILNQNVNINRSVQQNYVSETRYNALRRYYMLTLTYTLRKFGKKPKENNGMF